MPEIDCLILGVFGSKDGEIAPATLSTNIWCGRDCVNSKRNWLQLMPKVEKNICIACLRLGAKSNNLLLTKGVSNVAVLHLVGFVLLLVIFRHKVHMEIIILVFWSRI